MPLLCIALHTLNFYLVDNSYQELAEEIYEWKMSKDAKIKDAFEDSVFSIDTRFLLQFFRNDRILLRMKFFKAIIIRHTHTFIVRILIGIIRTDKIAELKSNTVKCFKWIQLLL